jgi:hypothetical protein
MILQKQNLLDMSETKIETTAKAQPLVDAKKSSHERAEEDFMGTGNEVIDSLPTKKHHDDNCCLWNDGKEREKFYPEKNLKIMKKNNLIKGNCVMMALSILTGKTPDYFRKRINTQDPVSWSTALTNFGMKLAYCPTDIRCVEEYMPELLDHDDLFLISYYTGTDKELLRKPDKNGWLCGSHIVILYRNQIFDGDRQVDAILHPCNNYHTKRIFRVVPKEHVRGL